MIQRLLPKSVDFHPSTGNRGDGLINEGAKQMMRKNGIAFRELANDEDSYGDTLLLIGAGGFCAPYNHMLYRTRFYAKRYSKVILASVTFEDKNFVDIPKNVVIVCRDKTSFDMVKERDNVFLDHDLAFQFDYEPYKKEGKGVIHSFRADEERTELRSDVDFSKGQSADWEALVKGCAEYQEIHTNRLHAAIAGAMLGKEVHLYPNSYHKNRSVWEYSLKGRGVSWQ